MKSRLVAFGLIACLLLTLCSGCKSNQNSSKRRYRHAVITVKDYGEIHLELDSKTAPITTQNFINLVGSGFYNGLTFHRVINNFMIQGGNPEAVGKKPNIDAIKGEFSANGISNSISHNRGVISMARSNDYNSATSQFFIVQKDSPHLDGQYAAFGRVTKGMDIVDKIAKQTPVYNSNGAVSSTNQPVITSIIITD